MNTENQNFAEKKILKVSLLFSLAFHLSLAFVSLISMRPQSTKTNVSMTAEFHIPKKFDDKKIASPEVNKIKETKVHKNTLPQLPEKFVIKEEPPKEKAVKHSLTQKEKKEEELKEKKKQETIELTKKEALMRLLKEKARLEKKEAEEDQIAIKEKLDRIQLLRSKKNENSQATESLSSEENDYGSQIQSWLHENYVLPEAFDFSIQKNEVLLELVLNHDGNVISVKILKASKSPVFDKFALNTVWKASPFPKPPNQWAQKPIQLQFTP